MNDKAPQVTNLKDAKMWIDQLLDVVGEQTKTIHECLNVSFTSKSLASEINF
jgi:hypothetical protein